MNRLFSNGLNAYLTEKGKDKFKNREEFPSTVDICCGSRMFYYDRNSNDVLYCDNRELHTHLCDGRALDVEPDMLCDFRNLPFEDESFANVVYDPPHLKQGGETSWLVQKYGKLPKDYGDYVKAGFDEAMRILQPAGALIFKWNEEQIGFSEIIKHIGQQPLFGDKRGKTRWVVFVKKAGDCDDL